MECALPKLANRCRYRAGIDLRLASQRENRLGQLQVSRFQIGVGLADMQQSSLQTCTAQLAIATDEAGRILTGFQYHLVVAGSGIASRVNSIDQGAGDGVCGADEAAAVSSTSES